MRYKHCRGCERDCECERDTITAGEVTSYNPRRAVLCQYCHHRAPAARPPRRCCGAPLRLRAPRAPTQAAPLHPAPLPRDASAAASSSAQPSSGSGAGTRLGVTTAPLRPAPLPRAASAAASSSTQRSNGSGAGITATQVAPLQSVIISMSSFSCEHFHSRGYYWVSNFIVWGFSIAKYWN